MEKPLSRANRLGDLFSPTMLIDWVGVAMGVFIFDADDLFLQ